MIDQVTPVGILSVHPSLLLVLVAVLFHQLLRPLHCLLPHSCPFDSPKPPEPVVAQACAPVLMPEMLENPLSVLVRK